MPDIDNIPQELCRVKKAVKELIKQNHAGLTHLEICKRLKQDSIFMGTYRNLLSQTSSALDLLTKEGRIKSTGKGTSTIFQCTE
jgi:hypothetical protein